MLDLTFLSARFAGIADLTGLETATHLATLDVFANEIDDLTPLSGLTNLTTLL